MSIKLIPQILGPSEIREYRSNLIALAASPDSPMADAIRSIAFGYSYGIAAYCGQAVGILTLRFTGVPHWDIRARLMVHVRESRRREGLGTAVVESLLRFAPVGVRVRVWCGTERAAKFWRTFGDRVINEVIADAGKI